ncbi:sugar ABC transporter ATP-binding protein [Pseudomonas sp. CCI3.2]|uniref:sugar ABC transporter ATP-binding protein n=1 Tax=unclassified Pseudomonas TaxID=196821 RepID=UPI002AC98144|nr:MULTISPECIES: sugar ABC transporter ATP-binding protein [unclassified Pseudomonas]MEB0078651.1 sugar ABC transporter ATP-binding protein [Pseudomonas sp. MH10out]MEB0093963.1 sugar ABC transporter ATP-binding protein [Pseudomonas sp. CCI4.2]MEB0104545.1 sugar ABC transporter ATP-binding protein [Pseudomonas sp. CCI3.2]MEB0131195.1 sugar ABC transporter ATP-binding protein [Pseudomonas sp. CCI2.4]MEB0158120.1 sugar ABC transporter ATP-binding protein [Pseudomonas sp. AH2 (2023)]
MSSLLKLENICKSYPGVQALSAINLQVERGEIHALLGENGAGKSTLMKILVGVEHQDEGSILIDGQAQQFATYNDAIAAGIGIVFQEFSLIPYLDAVENIFLGHEWVNRFGLLRKSDMEVKARELFKRLGVTINLHCPVKALSVAEQQFVEIAKALNLDARLLVLDEPTATLTPSEAELLFDIMRELKRQGVAVIFISHHLEEIFQVCDRISVLRDGKNVGVTDVADSDIDRLVEMMVGRRLENSFPPKSQTERGAVLLQVDDIQLTRNGPHNRFDLHQGEILGFAGLVGSGRTELALGILGAIPVIAKTVRLRGQQVALRDPAEALKLGIGLLPESRKSEGLIVDFSIRENISLNNLKKYENRGGLLDTSKETHTTQGLMSQLAIKAPSCESRVFNLSGGNQQKVVIARWINHHCDILVFDEPTRGIDVGAKAEIYALMRKLTEKGFAIIMISSELPEIIGMCDRVAVFHKGAIVSVLESSDVNPQEVMRHATGNTQREYVH